MKPHKLLTLLTGFALSISLSAQTSNDPVLMTVAGKQVTRSEFEYSYHKNGSVEGAVEKKTVAEYVPMFINYKLKVAAAEEAKIDTMQSYRKEFLTYRDMQLTPYLVDSLFIDSVAREVYANTVKEVDGKDLIETSHILLRLKQGATDTEKAAVKAKADSLCLVIAGGADFAEVAKQFSEDPGSAKQGGKLPYVPATSFVKEYGDAAYALKVGEVSAPVQSAFGYHIIKLTGRKPLDPYETLRPQIVEMLKKRNIEEASSRHRIDQIVKASNGKLTSEAVLDSVLAAHAATDNDLKYLVQEYHDGLLLYEISKREVWDVASNDSVGLEKWYKQHKAQYAWNEPRFKGFVFHCKDAKQVKAVKKVLKKYGTTDWKRMIKQQFNQDSIKVSVSGPYLCKKGENSYVDALAFKTGTEVKVPAKYAVSDIQGKVLKQPASWLDVRAQVTADYQAEKEKAWVEQLRKHFSFSVDEEVLKTVK